MPKLLLAILALALAPLAHAQATSPRQRTSFDANWRFIKGDPAEVGVTLDYANLKAALLANVNPADFIVRPTAASLTIGKDVSYAKPDFDDSSWRQLNLPHDWGIEGPFDESLDGATGRLPYFGKAWYRKSFTIPATDQGREIYLDVDGAMSYASIWLNGQYLGGWPYGYSSFRVDLTPGLKFGGNNVIAIRLDNPNGSSRWYPGGGLYRNLWLVKENPVHVAHWGEYVTTPQITPESATINVRVDLQNDSTTPATVSVRTQIFSVGADGKINSIALASTTPAILPLAANDLKTVGLSLQLPRPKLWDLQHPNLYAAVTTIAQDGKDVDSATADFGVRTIKFDPDNGFFLNGQRVEIDGVCDHSDLGPLGTVVNVRGLQRQIELLKEMGCNAIRTSHNMPAPELLDLCDRMGMLVMDESFDCWETPKNDRNGYNLLFTDWHEKDIRAEVRRDRNHPSIILWSVGNEIPQQGSARGNEILAELTKDVHEEDPTRMTITANNNTGFTDFNPAEYVYGFNYEPTHTGRNPKYDTYHQQNPTVCILGSETSSCISARGVYVYPVTDNKSGGAMANHLMSSYDLYAPPWADPPDDEFARQDSFRFVAGEFVWTGFDYIGEPTNNSRAPGDTSRSSYFGIIDLDGFPKDRFYLYQAHWRPDLPMAHLVPQDWNWKGYEGQTTPVFVYTSGDSAELFLNGKSLGKKTKEPLTYRLRWDDVKYEPGTLHVVAYKNGKPWATDTVKTTDAASQITLTPDRKTIADDGQDLSYVTVTIKDKAGLTVPDAMNALHYDVSGPGEIVAVDNGDETSLAPIQGTPDSKAFNGLALVIIRAKAGQTGLITLTAVSPGLSTTTVNITANAVKE